MKWHIVNEEGKYFTIFNNRLSFTDNFEFAYVFEDEEIEKRIEMYQEYFNLKLDKIPYTRKVR